MSNIPHSTLTGTDLHEPKGASAASAGQVYVANGSGSGGWTTIGTSSFTGLIADFPWPVVQAGWLECDGSDISVFTYPNLYSVMTIQTTGTHTNGSAIIAGIPTTANLRAGFYVFGTGFAAGTTVLSVDTINQITVSNPASGTGTSSLAVSPWFLNTGTIRLPDLSTAGRFRRSRTSSTAIGQLQADQNRQHQHVAAGTTGNAGAQSLTGSSTFTGTAATINVTSSLTDIVRRASATSYTPVASPGSGAYGFNTNSPSDTSVSSSGSYTPAGTISTTVSSTSDHGHPVSLTTDVNGGTESRPLSIVMMTCIKT